MHPVSTVALLVVASITVSGCGGKGSRSSFPVESSAGPAPVPSPGSAAPGTVVRVPEDARSLTSALALLAGGGGTVELAAGTYSVTSTRETFPLTVPGNVTVRGPTGGRAAVIDGEDLATVFRVVSASNVTFESLTVTRGRGTDGGAFELRSSSVTIRRCVLVGNRASSRGNAILVDGPGVVRIENNLLRGNVAVSGDPHTIRVDASSPVILNNTIVQGDGNGILIAGASSPDVRNNVIALNGKAGQGRGICSFSPTAVIAHNVFFANQLAALLVGGSGDVSGARANDLSPSDGIVGNLDVDPGFVDVPRDFSLGPAAGARDAGDPAGAYLDRDGTRNDAGHTGGPGGARLVIDASVP